MDEVADLLVNTLWPLVVSLRWLSSAQHVQRVVDSVLFSPSETQGLSNSFPATLLAFSNVVRGVGQSGRVTGMDWLVSFSKNDKYL